MHGERLDFKLEVATLESNRQASCFEGNSYTHFQLLTLKCRSISYTVYIKQYDHGYMQATSISGRSSYRIHTTTVRGHQKLVRGHKWPQGSHLAIPALTGVDLTIPFGTKLIKSMCKCCPRLRVVLLTYGSKDINQECISVTAWASKL